MSAPAGNASAPVIEFRRATVRVGPTDAGSRSSKTILSDFSLAAQRDETLVLLGRSGSGKTTAVKLINRLVEPTAGEVLVEGQSTRDWNPIHLRRRIGYVIQEAGLLPHFTVERNVALLPRLEGWPEERIAARVEELLALVGLPPQEFRHRYPRELSGGQRQRVGVARALAANASILLMDEPFGALDPITRAEMQREFRALQSQLKKTVVLVTHDLREALMLGTRIALLESGRLVCVHSPQDFVRAPETAAYVSAFGWNEQR
jgi:osmoprotectant transport system ATP-binding protein